MVGGIRKMVSDEFRFWSILPEATDGDRALKAYQHIGRYYQGCLQQYDRIYDNWRASSAIDPSAENAFEQKSQAMQQVVRDIHFLLVSLQVIWKTINTMCNNQKLYPSFTGTKCLRKKWKSYFEQYKDPRDTFEHYDDQVLGPDSKNKSPGYGVKLNSDGSFSLGTQGQVLINEDSKTKLVEFKKEFDEYIDSIVGAQR